MGQLDRRAEEAVPPQGEADTMLSALCLSRAGYRPAILAEGYLQAVSGGTADCLRQEVSTDLDTSVAWRATDRRAVVTALVRCAAETACRTVDNQKTD